jgi:c-di-GMP-binding flagellar brake protein YcgR
MKKDIIRVTQKIDIVEEDFNTLKKEIYFSRVEDIRADSILITPPFRKGSYLPPRTGRIITARVVFEKVPYLFESSLLRYISEQIPLWELSLPQNIKKIQMREDVRLDLGLPIKLTLQNDPEGGKTLKALLKDLSAGGMQVILTQPLPVGTKLNLWVQLSDDFIFEPKGTIVRLTPPLPPLDKYSAGIQFDEVDAATRQRIVRYIFGKQAEMRIKEKKWFE